MILQKLTQSEYDFFKQEVMSLLCISQVQQMNKFMQHGKVSCLEHSISVAYISYCITKQLHLQVDDKSLIRGAMLHDFFLYDWHKKEEWHKFHGYRHPSFAYQNAKRLFLLNSIEKDIIINHMWPLTCFHIPKSKEAKIVSIADKICAFTETFHIDIFQQDEQEFFGSL